jgi:hypothetical protein
MTKISPLAEHELVAGEPVRALMEALVQCMPTQIDDGWYRIDVELDAPTGDPLARALMRVEAEMLLHDADSIGSGAGGRLRDPDQRRADAFVELTHRVYEAITGGRLPSRQRAPLQRQLSARRPAVGGERGP